MTPDENKGVEALMKHWIFFHKIRCVVALVAHVCFVVGMQVSAKLAQES
jgi:hypothetical protein